MLSVLKKKRERFVHEGYYGLEFADDIAMFEVVDPKANKRNYTQLLISVYGIVYNICNLLIYSVVCGAQGDRTPDL